MAERFKFFEKDKITDEQRKVWDEVTGARGGAFPAPFHVLLENPDLCRTVTSVGVICRYKTALGPRLSELAILITARAWSRSLERGRATPPSLPTRCRGTSRSSRTCRRGRRPSRPRRDGTYGG